MSEGQPVLTAVQEDIVRRLRLRANDETQPLPVRNLYADAANRIEDMGAELAREREDKETAEDVLGNTQADLAEAERRVRELQEALTRADFGICTALSVLGDDHPAARLWLDETRAIVSEALVGLPEGRERV